MKKIAYSFLLAALLMVWGNCFAQITSCSFTLQNTTVCAPVTISAIANEVSSSSITGRDWYLTTCTGALVFDTSTGQSAVFSTIITTPGCYCLRLHSLNQNGDTCSYQQCNIIVAANPVANFTFYNTNGCLPLSVGAQCNSTTISGTIDSVVIDWGCLGVISYNTCPATAVSATYSRPTCLPGAQNVSVLVKNSFGCTARQWSPNLINLLPEPAGNFVVAHSFCFGSTVCVNDTTKRLNDSIINYLFDFGDGHINRSAQSCYIYNAPGTYNITLIENDILGCADTVTTPVIVFANPIANFSISDTVICSPQQICLTDLSTDAVQITNWLWNYGDNSGSSLSSPPCHNYPPPFAHDYTISLIVTDQNNCSDSVSIIETVNRLPQANFTWATSCEDKPMHLASTSVAGDGALNLCQWTFWLGAPSPVIDSNCATTFQFPAGNHTVQLVVTDDNGCTDTTTQSVITDSLTTLNINPADTTICLGGAIDYTASGVFDHINWMNTIWQSNPQARIDTVTPLGNITYTVSVQNGVCSIISDTFNVQVIQPVPVEVSAVPGQIVAGQKAELTSQVNGQIDSIMWTPDTALICANCANAFASPVITTAYTATVYYTRNNISCSNFANTTVNVLNSCESGIIYVPNTFTPNGDGKNDVLIIRGLSASGINYFRVWDRLGRLVFDEAGGAPNNPDFGWDGTDRQGKKLNPDVYVYTYEIQCVNGNIVTGQGNVTLAR